MKQLRLLLALLVASIGAVQGAWARVAPVFPSSQAKTLESGETYYLYNPGSDRFIYRNASSVKADVTNSTAFVVSQVEGDVFTLQVSGTSYYMISSSNDVSASSSTSSAYVSYRRFRIDAADGGYTMQRDYDYNDTYYVGNATGNSNIYANFTSGNIVWQLYDADGVSAILRYRAKKALYDALVSAEGYSLSFAIEDYEALYANDAATNDELTAAADAINNALLWKDMLATGETEYPVYTQLIGSATWKYDNGKYTSTTIKNAEGGLRATVEVDQDATLVYYYHTYNTYSINDYSFNVFLDGVLYQSINNYEGYSNQRFFIELTAGRHTIEWRAKSTNESSTRTFYLQNIAVYKTPTITVNLTQAGSLGTEVLYNVDHVKDVRKLVVKGNMNDDDWERINMMTGLFDLDLTETTVTSLPTINPGSFFHKIKLPAALTTIENSALKGTYIEEITFPESLTTIGNYAFYQTRIKEAVIPETVSSVGTYAFASNESLVKVSWSALATSIPDYCFYEDKMISDFTLPEGVTSIGTYAFQNNLYSNVQLPSTVTFIGACAFEDCDQMETLVIPDNCDIGRYAFAYCSKLKKVEIGEGAVFRYYTHSYGTFYGCTQLEEIVFPTTYNRIAYEQMLYNCTALKKVTFKSATMVGGSMYNSFFDGLGTDIAIYVPSYLVNTYKLDSYWYNYNIMGFSTADVTDWVIKDVLTFYSRDRFEGTPNIDLSSTGAWTINGDLAQNIGNFKTYYNTNESNGNMGSASLLVSNCDNVNITGNYTLDYYAYKKSNNSSYGRWNFISLPFDVKVNEITLSDNARFAIRYYDGANRAVNGTGGNWKDYDADATITAGTGFIIQVSKDCHVYFKALENSAKQYAVSNTIFTKALNANNSEFTYNKGWNLVGNPWQAYYNIHKLNFTGPITTYNGYTRTYSAYSVIDDDYAILPNQAFFVQCPDEVNSISFPVDGRQTTSVIESQNAARAEQPSERKLIDLEISDGEQTDKTRFVLNPKALMDYETQRDASKFFEEGTVVPQIYTIENGIQMAINERPLGEGTVQIGMRLAEGGTYTISAPRNQFQNIVLVDNETGMETLLADGESYSFSTNAGTNDSRFVLRVGGTVVTGVQHVATESQQTEQVYNLNGQRINEPQKGLYIVNGKKVMK